MGEQIDHYLSFTHWWTSTREDSSGTELKKNTTKDERKTRNSATKAKHKLR